MSQGQIQTTEHGWGERMNQIIDLKHIIISAIYTAHKVVAVGYCVGLELRLLRNMRGGEAEVGEAAVKL